MMDRPGDHQIEDEAQDAPRRSEAEVRAMLEQSRRDIAEGRTVPMGPVLDRMRATAKRVRRERAGADRRPA